MYALSIITMDGRRWLAARGIAYTTDPHKAARYHYPSGARAAAAAFEKKFAHYPGMRPREWVVIPYRERLSMNSTNYGPGDPQTWPMCTGHPSDPRTEDVEGLLADGKLGDIPVTIEYDVGAFGTIHVVGVWVNGCYAEGSHFTETTLGAWRDKIREETSREA